MNLKRKILTYPADTVIVSQNTLVTTIPGQFYALQCVRTSRKHSKAFQLGYSPFDWNSRETFPSARRYSRRCARRYRSRYPRDWPYPPASRIHVQRSLVHQMLELSRVTLAHMIQRLLPLAETAIAQMTFKWQVGGDVTAEIRLVAGQRQRFRFALVRVRRLGHHIVVGRDRAVLLFIAFRLLLEQRRHLFALRLALIVFLVHVLLQILMRRKGRAGAVSAFERSFRHVTRRIVGYEARCG